MPFREATFPFEPGDDDMADFMENIWRPFATDATASGGLGWIEQAAARGTHPNFEFLFSRGAIAAEEPPFIFFQTTEKTLYIFTGNGVNTVQEPYDQPGNPMNQPPDAVFSDPTSMRSLRCLALTTVVGPYEAYWLFGGLSAEYLHCVVKVNSRQYRHFHVGMLTPLHPDLHADSFYVTNHRWGWLNPDNLAADNSGINTNNKEHKPYEDHILPFRNNGNVNTTSGDDCRSCGLWIYSPAYGSEALDWWFPVGKKRSTTGSNGGADETIGRVRNSAGGGAVGATAITKDVGDVNNANDAVAIGAANVTGYDQALGTVPFACEPTFTTDGVALNPIYIGLPTDFESELRWGNVAQIPDVFRINMKTYQPEQEITDGSDIYVLFPMINKDSNNTLANEGYSGFEGLAYKKLTANAT